MNLDQLTQGILAKFIQHRIVFWHDPEQSFQSDLPNLALDDITVLDMQGRSLFETKKRIELDEPQRRFLLYFPHSEPEPEKDWLLDMRLYSVQFFADASSMLLHELGIPKMALRIHIRERQGFFNKKNTAALKRLVTENEDELSLDRKMMAVLLKSESASLADILLSLLKDYAVVLEAGDHADDSLPSIALLQKYALLASLWDLLRSEFSYQNEQPSLPDFVLKLFCTELWSQLDGLERDWLLHNVLKTAAGRSTALALLANWRDSLSYSKYYQTIATVLERQLEVSRRLADAIPEQLVACKSFEAIEQSIIRGLVATLLEADKALDAAYFESVLSERRTSYWCRVKEGYYAHIYIALQQAERLFSLRRVYVDGFHYPSARDMYLAYADTLFRFDQSYRLFNEHVQGVNNKGGDILRCLDEAVEHLYTNWYLYELGLAWDRHLANEQRMTSWSLPGVASQQQFYRLQVERLLAGKQVKRVFVVISDALRYEVAEELTLLMNTEKRFKAEITSQLGVLPSYTQLGMAALLPHQQLSYGNGSAVLVDGQSSMGLDNRHRLLAAVNGMAVSSRELMGWSKPEGRDRVRDKTVVYIYHDTIDAICDKREGEERTPTVCREALSELNHLIGRIINNLNGSRVLLTADHGFLFQQQMLEQADKTELLVKPNDTIETKKRYIIGRQLPSFNECWKGRIADTANGSDDTEFLLPKGAQRFHFVGGARFVHGGAMLQEVCVPVVHIRELEKKSIAQHEKQAVGVVAASQPIRLVNNIDKVRFIQTEPLGECFKARKLEVYVIDPDGNQVSSREPINFDSTSNVMEERIREARLKLVGSGFNRRTIYTLVLEDGETRTRYSDYAVTIDLAFGQDDFF